MLRFLTQHLVHILFNTRLDVSSHEIHLFCGTQFFFLFELPVFSRALSCVARGGGCVYTTAQMRAPAEDRGACSGDSKPRNLASNHGEPFPPARAKQVHGHPVCPVCMLDNIAAVQRACYNCCLQSAVWRCCRVVYLYVSHRKLSTLWQLW